MRLITLLSTAVVVTGIAVAPGAGAEDKPVGITQDAWVKDKVEGDIKDGVVMGVPIKHGKETVIIQRNQDNKATVNPAFAKTSRPCPPFCIQPAQLAPGVDTIGEVELISYAKRMSDGDKTIVLIDSRTPDWVAKGTIPGAINVPWTKLNPAKGATPIDIAEIMQGTFNVTESEGLFNFSEAKTAVMFCNGMWCGQSPNNIQNLLKYGYPAHKIKWYRGGMQDWEILGLTTAKPQS
ncbi:MAG: rhodanese-like domain-containing protein [Gammaproteobacteria bacterium]|nr:rhodanese-like domain-containing protein [Gammaproteobacteria bacterium]